MRPNRISLLITLGVAMVAFNLRTIAVAIGPVLPDLAADLGMTQTVAGVLTALPTLCFAVFGFLAPRAAASWGLHRAVLFALLVNIVGQVLRIRRRGGRLHGRHHRRAGRHRRHQRPAATPCQVALPVRDGWSRRHVTSQTIGLTLAGLYTAPLAIALGGWRAAFWLWVVTAVLGVPMMVWSTRRFAEPRRHSAKPITLRDAARTRLGWMMMIFFGTQSAQAYSQFGWLPTIYQDAGFTPIQAGNYLTILTGLGIPLSFIVPTLTYRLARPIWLLALMAVSGVAGYVGLINDPAQLPWLWPALLSLAGAVFPMILVLIGTHTSTPAGAAALSGFAQSVGYVLASLGPLLVGLLKDATGSFTLPLWVQAAMFIPLLICGVIVIRSGTLEQELGLPPEPAQPAD